MFTYNSQQASTVTVVTTHIATTAQIFVMWHTIITFVFTLIGTCLYFSMRTGLALVPHQNAPSYAGTWLTI